MSLWGGPERRASFFHLIAIRLEVVATRLEAMLPLFVAFLFQVY